MKNLLLPLLLLLAGVAWGDNFSEAVKAHNARNYNEAARLFKLSAAQGDAASQFNLGIMYYTGQGIVQDYAEAAHWYKLSAAQGHAGAQFNLGHMYYDGQGVVQDYGEAVRLYKLSAAQGNAGAQFNLGFMYYNGRGVVQDYTRAHMWFNLAAVSGHEESAWCRADIAEEMTAREIAEAQRRAREWLSAGARRAA